MKIVRSIGMGIIYTLRAILALYTAIVNIPLILYLALRNVNYPENFRIKSMIVIEVMKAVKQIEIDPNFKSMDIHITNDDTKQLGVEIKDAKTDE